MINYIIVGTQKDVVTEVLRAICSFTDARSIVIGGRETAGLRWSNLCERVFTVQFDGCGDDYFVEMIAHYADKMPHLVLIPADSDAIRMVNRVRDRISVNITASPDATTIDTFANGTRFRQLCAQHHLTVLPSIALHPGEIRDFSTLASELGVPFVLKPTRTLLSGGAYLIYDKRDFEQAMGARVSTVSGTAVGKASFIAQRHVDGVDLELGLLADRGQISALAIQRTAGARTTFEPNPALQAIAARLCRLTAYHGVLHLKARVENQTGKIYLIESAPHFWPGLTASVWCGLNFVAESIKQTPRRRGVRQLESGSFALRHPIIRPASWSRLIGDAGAQGKLLRSMTFDTYSLAGFVRNLPLAMLRYAARCTVAQRRMRHKLAASSLTVDLKTEQNRPYIRSSQA